MKRAHGLLAFVIVLFVCSLNPSSVSANQFASLPKPDWTFSVPEEHTYMSNSNVRITDTTYNYLSMDNQMYILNKKTGKLMSSTSYTAGTNLSFSFFGTYAQVDKNGTVYILTPIKNAAGVVKQRLRAYHPDGHVLWDKYFNEKIRSLSGVSLMPDGNLFVYLETASDRVISYRYNPKGKFLGKNTWNASIYYGFVDGYLQTINRTSKTSSRMTYYDSKLKEQFRYNFDFKEGVFAGLGYDGYLYLEKNLGNNVTSFTAKTKEGKVAWTKKISNLIYREGQNNSERVSKDVFSFGFTGILSNGNFIFIDRKGVMQTVKASAKSYQTASDGTVMLVEDSQVSIYQASKSATTKLKLLHTMNTSEIDGSPFSFVYEGGGILYYMNDSSQITRYDLNKSPVAIVK
ncbi:MULTISPECIES: hypothetical protein [Paenibacillus]|uniref:Uncharacterized protein n=1 Tax=Paenibacillus vandeheii TaxID=3035917 RepID=A0ABT8JFK5_9BACL|nr:MULTISPECIES: hypothetical protein [Paenibacillus]KGP81353.1 hypothetical protein P363_0128065 [Paenibacillus sp. MAEPY1]KGP81989.1 hypothetical protein P364_0114320 [Paenibacillus sp. MAEPY2]MDN4603908.1 hypothetical protein [Paenibacillus vandeheii]